ncbi:hypothetical protein [Dickeya dianthicola]|uniref:hypothetical protein n=1 Tax=Dickeya dianthicola TaxID=204039 RepID=UPI0012691C83|nr:hypothetical protein [Dickeya dianthicola]
MTGIEWLIVTRYSSYDELRRIPVTSVHFLVGGDFVSGNQPANQLVAGSNPARPTNTSIHFIYIGAFIYIDAFVLEKISSHGLITKLITHYFLLD